MPEEWHPTNEELEVIDSAWMKVKVALEKIKEQTTANKKYISNMLNEIADHYQENQWLMNGNQKKNIKQLLQGV